MVLILEQNPDQFLETFLIHWCEKLREIDSQNVQNANLLPSKRKCFFEKNVKIFRQIKEQRGKERFDKRIHGNIV